MASESNDYDEDYGDEEGRGAMIDPRAEVDKNLAYYATRCQGEGYNKLSGVEKMKHAAYCKYLELKVNKSNKIANKYSQGGNKSRKHKSRKHKSRKHKSRKHKNRKH